MKRTNGTGLSESTFIGNTNSGAYYNSTLNAANDEAQTMLDQKTKDVQDATVEYLSQMNFASKFTDIRDDIHSLRDDGVTLKGNSTYTFEGLNI